GAGVPHPDPCRDASGSADRHDCHGRHEPHGLGDVPAPPRSFQIGGLADNGEPSPEASRAISMQLRTLFPVLGSPVRHRPRPFLSLISGLLMAMPLIGAPAHEPSPTGVSVSIHVTELRNAKGVVRACMSPDPKTFPRC